MTQELVPFGKYRGQPIQVMAQDKQYIEWVQQQGWLAEKYPQINTLIINNFAEPSETPDHNRMQGMFLNEDFCIKFIEAYSNFFKDLDLKFHNYIKSFIKNFGRIYETKFEVNAIDVFLAIETKDIDVEVEDGFYYVDIDGSVVHDPFNPLGGFKDGVKRVQKTKIIKERKWLDLRIEIKPCIGDDYPAVLRQIRSLKGFGESNIFNILFISEYNGKGISENDFVKLFLTQGITVIFLRNIK